MSLSNPLEWLKRKISPGKPVSDTMVEPPKWEEKIAEKGKDPTEVGPFRIISLVGTGGMGRVFSCERIDAPGPRYALKQLVSVEFNEVARFKREILIGMKVSHPNLCGVLDWGVSPQGRYYLLMELLEGKSLESIIPMEAPMSLDKVRSLILPVLDGLEALHDIGIVHRDLKPSNIFVTREGKVKIMDFGIATGMGPELTKTGQVVGTLQFISPEQLIDSKRVSFQADLFNVGLIAYQMLTAHLPTQDEDDSMDEVLGRLMSGDYIPLSEYRSDLPPSVGTWLDGLLQFELKDRFATVAAVRNGMKF